MDVRLVSLPPIFDGVTGVAETRQSVELKFWVQLPGIAPTFPRPMVRAAPSHGEGSEFESLGNDHFNSRMA